MKVTAYSYTHICVQRKNGQVIMRTIKEDTPHGRQQLAEWIERYKARKAGVDE